MSINWKKLNRRDDIYAELVDLHKTSSVKGELIGLDPASVKITEGYTTDSIVQANFETYTADGNDGWIDGLRIRLYHVANGYRKNLITGFVSARQVTEINNIVNVKYTLDSSLYSIANDALTWEFVLSNGVSKVKAAEQLLKIANKEYDTSNAIVERTQQVSHYEVGATIYDILNDLAGMSNRLDVNGEGVIIFSKYEKPSDRPATIDIDAEANSDMVIGDIQGLTDRFSVPGRVIITYNSSDNKMYASYDAPNNFQSSSSNRGYMIAKVQNTAYEKPTQDQLNAEAKNVFYSLQDPGNEWKIKIPWADIHEGDMVNFTWLGTRKCLVKSASFDCSSMTESLTLMGV